MSRKHKCPDFFIEKSNDIFYGIDMDGILIFCLIKKGDIAPLTTRESFFNVVFFAHHKDIIYFLRLHHHDTFLIFRGTFIDICVIN